MQWKWWSVSGALCLGAWLSECSHPAAEGRSEDGRTVDGDRGIDGGVGTEGPTASFDARSEETTTAAANTTCSLTSPLPGYVHTVDVSRLALGAILGVSTEGTSQRTIGEHGFFLLDQRNGWAQGVVDADAPISREPPSSGEVHAEIVRRYFEQAGVPACQIGDVGTSSEMTTIYPPSGPPINMVGPYTAVVARVFQGISIGPSKAIASLNVAGESTRESVYWPEIPASVLGEAVEFAADFADGALRSEYLARIGYPDAQVNGNIDDGPVVSEVEISHTPALSVAPFEARAVVSVADGPLWMQFDRNGELVP